LIIPQKNTRAKPIDDGFIVHLQLRKEGRGIFHHNNRRFRINTLMFIRLMFIATIKMTYFKFQILMVKGLLG